MVEALISVRRARLSDAAEIAAAHDASWRDAYRGLIPGRELERMIARRGESWWSSAILRGTRLLVLDFDESVAGYVSYGRNRLPSLSDYSGEIFELYLAPEFQGLGFGARLFRAARQDLADYGLGPTIVWALKDNERATGFYARLGGKPVRTAPESFGATTLDRIAFGFD